MLLQTTKAAVVGIAVVCWAWTGICATVEEVWVSLCSTNNRTWRLRGDRVCGQGGVTRRSRGRTAIAVLRQTAQRGLLRKCERPVFALRLLDSIVRRPRLDLRPHVTSGLPHDCTWRLWGDDDIGRAILPRPRSIVGLDAGLTF
jgi:hypothetical protein